MAKNQIAHFEIPAEQPEALTKFYGDLFGWKFQQVPVPGMEYWMCDAGEDGPGISGAVMKRQNPQQPAMNYVAVESVDSAVEKATASGATIALPKMAVPGGPVIAVLIDPQGNLFGLLEQPAA